MKSFINRLSNWDIWVFTSLAGLTESPELTRFFFLISKSADGYLYPFLGLILLSTHFSLAADFWTAGLIAFAIELPIYKLIKQSVRRSRPYRTHSFILNKVKPPDEFSFPSGHTAAAFIMATLLTTLAPELAIPTYLWASLVGVSRVYLGVHYPTDVLVGMVLGLVSASIGIGLAY